MGISHGLVALVVIYIVVRLYMWCQILYWSSPAYQEDWERHKKRQKRRGLPTGNREE